MEVYAMNELRVTSAASSTTKMGSAAVQLNVGDGFVCCAGEDHCLVSTESVDGPSSFGILSRHVCGDFV